MIDLFLLVTTNSGNHPQGEKSLAVGAIHEGAASFCGKASFHTGLVFEDVEYDAPDRSKVLRCVAFPGPVVILSKAGVQDPAALIFETPMQANCFLKKVSILLTAVRSSSAAPSSFPYRSRQSWYQFPP